MIDHRSPSPDRACPVRAIPVLALVAATACAPQSAKLIDGEYLAFLASTNSISLLKETVDPADYDTTFNVDCREFETKEDRDALELDNPLPICGPNSWPPPYETWASQSGYYAVTEKLDPWRGEGFITGEGDLQISFHHRVPGGADFRFIIAVDPEFGPVTCRNNPDGTFDHVRRDGDWVAEWSTELDRIAGLSDEERAWYPYLDGLEGGQLFFLNASGYQIDPKGEDEDTTYWSVPREWMAGAAQGKFSEENLSHRSPRYGEPEAYNFVSTASASYDPNAGDDMFYCDLAAGEDATTNACMADLDAHLGEVVVGTQEDLALLGTPDGGDEPVIKFAPVQHLNDWRPADGFAPGFDGWGELHYSYVAFKKGANLEVGGSAEGSFGLVLEAVDSQTKVFVQGKFEIPRIRRDKWTTNDLERDTIEKNGTQLCEAASWQDANLPKAPAE
jgi:hypothetical protein